MSEAGVGEEAMEVETVPIQDDVMTRADEASVCNEEKSQPSLTRSEPAANEAGAPSANGEESRIEGRADILSSLRDASEMSAQPAIGEMQPMGAETSASFVTGGPPHAVAASSEAIASSGDSAPAVAADPLSSGAGALAAGLDDAADEDSAKKEDLGVSIPVARVKRMMKCNPDKKKNFSREAVHAVAAGMELFLADFSKTAYQFTAEKKRKTLLIADVAECIRLIPRFEFLDGPGILPDVEDRQKRAKGASVVPPPVPTNTSVVANMGAALAGTVPASAPASVASETAAPTAPVAFTPVVTTTTPAATAPAPSVAATPAPISDGGGQGAQGQSSLSASATVAVQ